MLVKVISPCVPISIHAPLRERPVALHVVPTLAVFQSTLPRGSDIITIPNIYKFYNFNPRSLAGATYEMQSFLIKIMISIHAPSRERLYGSGYAEFALVISIHAPSRERRLILFKGNAYGYFNPRSLAGATVH